MADIKLVYNAPAWRPTVKSRLQFSPRALLSFVIFLVGFGALVALDKGTGLVSRIWLPLFWGGVGLTSLAIYVRMWRARGSSDEVRNVEARSLYGVLPSKLGDWLFP
jgi:hypothetical protein